MTSSPWPRARTVAAAVTGVLAEVLRAPEPIGLCLGLRSADPEVVLIVGRRGGQPLPTACCFRCGTAEPAPPPPAARGLDGTGNPVVQYGSHEHALFLLTWLHRFLTEHEHAEPAAEQA